MLVNDSEKLRMIVTLLVAQSPILGVSLLACIIVLVNWKVGSRGSIWALSGFGLSLLLGIAIPIVQSNLQIWSMQTDQSNTYRTLIFARLSFLWSILRAASYVFLLIAVFAGRATWPASQVPPLRQS